MYYNLHLGIAIVGSAPYLVKVVDELREVLDGVDVVVGRRRDEWHARLAAAQVGNVGAHLLRRQLPTLACAHMHTFQRGVPEKQMLSAPHARICSKFIQL